MELEEHSNETMEVNSDSDSSATDEEEQALTSKAEELERQLSNNKYLYDVHLQLVNIYEQLTDLVSMRMAYERFHECFPLTPEIWLKWINHEKTLASSEAETKYILKLFETAVEDYLSVDLWIEYAQFSMGATDSETTRSVLEKGLNAAGLHTAKGSLLWDTLREFEYTHLSAVEENSDLLKEQIIKIVEVFKRQLSIPLIGMEKTHEEWSEFFKNVPEDFNVSSEPIKWGYQKALKTLQTYKPFEDKLLVTTEESKLYQVYCEYVKAVTDPSTVLCIYERAVSQLCLNANVWLDYCFYAMKLGEPADKISQRALRNCPWSEELWMARLRILEHLERSEDELIAAFEQGISNMTASQGVELWLTYLEIIRRTNNKEKLYKLFEQAIEQYRHDNTSKIQQFYARILAQNSNMPEGRKIWKGILKKNKSLASVWLECINLERQYGETSQVRSLFQRAITSCTDWPQYIAEEWLMFERQFGSLQDVLKCTQKCSEITQNQVQQTPQVQETQNGEQQGRKRKLDETEPKSESKKNKLETEQPVRKARILKDPAKTVFVSNLHPGINEKKLKKMFPNAVNLEVVLDRKGKSRCYGYVQFSIEEEVMHALARDRELLDGRPVFISNCKPDKVERKQAFKYSTEVETNKLFVKGLPVDKKQEDVEEIFKPYGATNVRLVLKKNGQPKGLAYVEFPDEEKAKAAIEKTDQMKFGEETISVAVSAPPPKSAPQVAKPVRHARSRLQVPLVPRSVHVKNFSTSDTSSDTKITTSKNNEDFRKMFIQ